MNALEPRRRLRELSLPTRRSGCNDFPLKNAAGVAPAGGFLFGGLSKTTRTNARQGTSREMHNTALIEWIKFRSQEAELVLSVCTGALHLAKAEPLDNLEATTHHGAIDLLREVAPKTMIPADRRFVDNGRIVCSAGIAAGIDTGPRPGLCTLARSASETPADSGKARYSPDGNQRCCYGSSARSCYGWQSGRSTLDC
jgi:hypothetical protein